MTKTSYCSYTDFFVVKMICEFFVAKTIYALCPKSCCVLKFAIRKVQTFRAFTATLPLVQLDYISDVCCNVFFSTILVNNIMIDILKQDCGKNDF